MNKATFNETYLLVTKSQRPVLNRFLRGDSDDEISQGLGTTRENVRQHMSKICQLFDVTDQTVEGRRFREALVELFRKYKPELLGNRWTADAQELMTDFPDPSGALDLRSSLYINRELNEHVSKQSIEDKIKENIMEPRALIRIIAPSKFGKTSLLLRIEKHAISQGFRTVRINIKQEFGQDTLQDWTRFLQFLCRLISDRLNSFLDLDNFWQDRLTPQINCTRYIEELLGLEKNPFMLILDGVEAFYTADLINQEFFQMLRRWHDNGASKDSWLKIRQVMAYSSDNYGNIDIARSPFNIGRCYELLEFNESNIIDLTQKLHLNWDKAQAKQLMSLIGGHPYLVNLALHHLNSHRNLTLEQLLYESSLSTIYQKHLESLANYLERDPELSSTLASIIDPAKVIKVRNRPNHILYGMGVIKNNNSEFRIRCDLYQKYFKKHFSL